MGTNAEELPAESCSGGSRARQHHLKEVVLLLVCLAAFFLGPHARAQQASDCLLCHGPSTGLKNSQGKDITVSPSHMKGPHGTLSCTYCHADASAQTHSAKTASASC